MTVCMRVNKVALTATRKARLSRLTSDIFARRAFFTTGRRNAAASSTSTSQSSFGKNAKNSSSATKEPSASLNKEKQNGDRNRGSSEPWSGAGPALRPLYKAPPRASSMSSPEMRAMLLSLLALVEIIFCLNLAHMIWAAKRQARVVVLMPMSGATDRSPLTEQVHNQNVNKPKEDQEKTFLAAPTENVSVSEQLNDLVYPLIIVTTSVVAALLLLWIPSRTATRVDFHIPSQSVRVHHPGIKRLFPSPVEFKLGDLYTKELLAHHPATNASSVGGLSPLSMGSKPVLLYAQGQRFPRTLDPTGEFNVKKFNEIFYGADNHGK